MTEDALKIKWHTELLNVAALKEWSKNPRKITETEYKRLIESIKTYGFHDVLKIDTDGTIISGHQRKRALMEIGVEQVHVMKPDRQLTEKEREVIAVASNTHRGQFDHDILANQFDSGNLLEAGFTGIDLREPDAMTPKAQPGEVYLLNDHKVTVGETADGLMDDLLTYWDKLNGMHALRESDKKKWKDIKKSL